LTGARTTPVNAPPNLTKNRKKVRHFQNSTKISTKVIINLLLLIWNGKRYAFSKFPLLEIIIHNSFLNGESKIGAIFPYKMGKISPLKECKYWTFNYRFVF
jgi:hypothetical protein